MNRPDNLDDTLIRASINYSVPSTRGWADKILPIVETETTNTNTAADWGRLEDMTPGERAEWDAYMAALEAQS